MQQSKKGYNWLVVLKFCIVGLLLISAFSLFVDYGVQHSDYRQTGKVNNIVNHRVDPGIIIFGSSVSEVGINPAVLQKKTGLTAYNCSIDGTRFMQYKGLIEEFQSYSKNNQYVVLAETYFSFEMLNAISEAERYLAQLKNKRVYHALYSMQPDLVWKCRFIPFYKYVAVSHVYYKNALIGWGNILHGVPRDSSFGFAPVYRLWEPDADETIRNTPRFSIHTDSIVLKSYVQTIQSLQQSGKKVIIVLTPMYINMLKKITDIAPLRSKLSEVAAATGARFLDFSSGEISSEQRYFYNSIHMNVNGANAFSAMLADSLNVIMHGTVSR